MPVSLSGTDDGILLALSGAADAVSATLASTPDWGLAGTRDGQHHSDLAADEVAVRRLVEDGFGVLSEESGRHHPERPITVVLDPLDGSTNAFRGVSWHATSLCAVDGDGARASLVVDLVHGTRYAATRAGGARRDGVAISTSGAGQLADAIIGVNGLPSHHWGWAQFRALGAAALDLCAVADGRLDGFVDCTDDGLAPWDFLGGVLACLEAGGVATDLHGRPLIDLDPPARRTIVAAATEPLHAQLLAARLGPDP